MADNATAYGFTGLSDVRGSLVTRVGEEKVLTAIRESAAEHSRQARALFATAAVPTETAKMVFVQPGSGELQPIDDWGNPQPQPPGDRYEVAFPIRGGGTAFATNRVSREYMTVEQANQMMLDGMGRDTRWLRKQFLASVLSTGTWTYTDTALNLGSLTIQPLANGDSNKYVRVGAAVPATDSHYLNSSLAISTTADPYGTIYSELAEHPGNTGPYVVYISDSMVAATEALTGFVAVVDSAIEPALTAASLRNFDVENIRGLGDEVLGRHQNMWIVRWSALPAGYAIAHARGAGPICGMREHIPSSLKGLFIENNSPDGNIAETRLLRYAGFGVMNRTAAVAFELDTASTAPYSAPSGYTAPTNS